MKNLKVMEKSGNFMKSLEFYEKVWNFMKNLNVMEKSGNFMETEFKKKFFNHKMRTEVF